MMPGPVPFLSRFARLWREILALRKFDSGLLTHCADLYWIGGATWIGDDSQQCRSQSPSIAGANDSRGRRSGRVGGEEDVLSGFAVCADGTRLSYELYGAEAAAPRIVLIHSMALDRTFWTPVIERLKPFASVLAYDCRGHGASDKPAGLYSVELFARDLASLLDHIGWSSATVAGASMGGCVSLAFADAFASRTVSLGLIDTTAWYGAEAPAQWAQRAARAKQEGLAAMADFQAARWFGDLFRSRNPDLVRQYTDIFLASDLDAYGEACRMLGAADLRAALAKISCPTTIIVGEEDYATPPAMAQAMHVGIRRSRLVTLEGARHLTPLEMPDRVASELKALLRDGVAA